jgi:hypothetical protein
MPRPLVLSSIRATDPARRRYQLDLEAVARRGHRAVLVGRWGEGRWTLQADNREVFGVLAKLRFLDRNGISGGANRAATRRSPELIILLDNQVDSECLRED